jgi:hypothetical protein
MGFLFKSKTQTTEAPFESNPWQPQQQYLTGGFDAAQGALNTALNSSTGPDNWTAGMNNNQTQFLNGTMQNGQNIQSAANNAIQAGSAGIGYLGNFQNNSNTLFNQAGVNQVGNHINDASQYAGNPFLQGQIDAALGDVNRAFRREVGDINSGASATGNINSTRAGALEARAMDDAMDRGAAISSQMRGQAYESGLDRAMTNSQNMFNNQFAANTAIGAGANQALQFAGAGYQLGQNGMMDGYGAATQFQNQEQRQIDGQIAQNQYQTHRDLNLVNQYMQAVGGNYGSNGFQTSVSQQASPLQQLAGAAATGLGVYKAF